MSEKPVDEQSSRRDVMTYGDAEDIRLWLERKGNKRARNVILSADDDGNCFVRFEQKGGTTITIRNLQQWQRWLHPDDRLVLMSSAPPGLSQHQTE